MKKDSIYAIMAGICITLVVLLSVVELLSPRNVSLFIIPSSIFVIFLWLNAWRITRKRQKPAPQTETPK